jgi:hypothetical protein
LALILPPPCRGSIERAQPHLGDGAGAVRADVAKEVADDAQREVVRLDLARYRERAELGNEGPVAAHDALHQPRWAELVEAAILAVAGRRREDEREVARMPGLEEPPLELADQLVRRTCADEARESDRIAIADDGDRFGAETILFFNVSSRRRPGPNHPSIQVAPLSFATFAPLRVLCGDELGEVGGVSPT